MFCKNCGYEITGTFKFCQNCGAVLESEPEAKENVSDDPATVLISSDQTVSDASPAAQQQADFQFNQQPGSYYAVTHAKQSSTTDYPMKWFKFLIYFLLFFFALINLGNAAMLFTGFHYERNQEGARDLVYSVFPKLKTIDIVFGVLFIIMAVFVIFVRFRLAGYKENGPRLLYFYFASVIVINLIYAITVKIYLNSVNPQAGDAIKVFSTVWPLMIFWGLMIIVNRTYFEKRFRLFIN